MDECSYMEMVPQTAHPRWDWDLAVVPYGREHGFPAGEAEVGSRRSHERWTRAVEGWPFLLPLASVFWVQLLLFQL